jgi:hypothetical protein
MNSQKSWWAAGPAHTTTHEGGAPKQPMYLNAKQARAFNTNKRAVESAPASTAPVVTNQLPSTISF